MPIDTAVKRRSAFFFLIGGFPIPDGALTLPDWMTILGRYSGVTIVGVAGGRAIAFHIPDEVPVGEQVTIAVQYIGSAGERLRFDSPPIIGIYSVNPTTGVETTELALATMTEAATTGVYRRTWTPSIAATFVLDLRAIYSSAGVNASLPVTARPRFDPIAIAMESILVSRM